MEYESFTTKFSLLHWKKSPGYLVFGMALLHTAGFITACLGHLENSGPHLWAWLLCRSGNVKASHYVICPSQKKKKITLLVSPPIPSEKSLLLGCCQAHSSKKFSKILTFSLESSNFITGNKCYQLFSLRRETYLARLWESICQVPESKEPQFVCQSCSQRVKMFFFFYCFIKDITKWLWHFFL